MHVDVALVEHRRLDADGRGPRADIGGSSRDRLLHHVAQVAGHRHLALARHHQRFDRQDLAADFRPCKAGDDTDLVLALGLAIAILRHAEILLDDVRRHGDLLLALARHQLLHRLAGE